MGRRRRREKDNFEAIKAVVILVFLLLFAAVGFNIKAMAALVQGLVALALFGGIALVVGGILFLIIRHFVRKNNAGSPSSSSGYSFAQPQRPTPVQSATPPTSGEIWREDGPLLDETPNPDFGEPPLSRNRTMLVPPERITFAKSPPSEPVSIIAKLRATDWYQFEKVVGLVYQSQGYRLTRRGGANPDGGIDLIVEKDGERAAVQCKRWKKWKVDVPKVRELFGAMTHEGLSRGVIVALNGFTLEAKQLAVEHNIDIVHDENLAVMIAGLAGADQRRVQAMLDDETKHCPKCESVMVWRTPKPGKKQFAPFWGCSRYPQCYGRMTD